MTATVTPASQVCRASTKSGSRCKRKSLAGELYCKQHSAQATPMPNDINVADLASVIDELEKGRSFGKMASSFSDEFGHVASMLASVLERVRDAAIKNNVVDAAKWESFAADTLTAALSIAGAFGERMGGNYDEDDFGFDEEFTNSLIPIVGLLYDYYWRVDVEGIENVPSDGSALLVSNHAGGGLPFDGAMMKMAILREHPNPRHLRILVLDWLMGLPWLADMMRKTGQALACTPNAVELLQRGQLVAAFPEGVKGMAKPFSDRYNLQRFGRGGFVKIAIRTGAPIVPVAVVGSEEIYPKIGNLPFVNKLIGAPFVPVTPTFPLLGLAGLIPLPSKWHIEFCDPIDVSQYGPEAADDRQFVLELSERIRSTIQERLRANLLKRSTPFW